MKKLMLFIIGVSLIFILGCSTIFPGKVLFPKEPNVSKPDNFLYCDTDDDCGTTSLRLDNCCTLCVGIKNQQAITYLQEWNTLNCEGFSPWGTCPHAECLTPTNVRCENNKCIGDFE